MWKKLARRGTASSNVSEEGSDGWRESPHRLRDAMKARLDLCQAAAIDRTHAHKMNNLRISLGENPDVNT